MEKMKVTRKAVKRRKVGKENAEPESQNNSLWDNLLGDINDFVGRRSDVGKRSLRLEYDETITDVDINNDEQEKEDLRREKERERLAREKEAKVRSQSGLERLNSLSQAELDQHYSKCIEMCNKNKVNVKNAFKLQLIDYMKLIVSNQSTKSENLTLMSCTLGASAKIYAHRVDKVYTDMIKMVSGKEGEVQRDENSDDEKKNDDDDENEEKVQTKKIRTMGESDEESDDDAKDVDMEKMLLSEAQLNKGKGEGEEIVEKTNLPRDLEYFMECRQLDPDGLIHLNPPLITNTPLERPPNIPFVSIGDEPPFSDNFVATDLSEYIKDYKDIRKCFSILGGGEESVNYSGMLNSSLTFDPSSNVDIPDAIRIDAEERDRFCEDGVSPDSWAPDYDEHDSDNEIPFEKKTGQVSVGQPKTFDTKAMARLVSADAGDYSFFDNRVDFWAGPSHWTIKRTKVGEKTQKPTNETQKKTVKKTNAIEFTEEKVVELKKLYSGIEDATLTRRTIINWCGRKWKIPREVSYTQKKLLSLMKNEHLLYVKKDSNTNMISSSHLNGEEDALLSPDDFGGDMGHDDHYDDDDSPHLDEKESLSFLEERPPSPPIHLEDQPMNCGLIPAPQRVAKVNLKFAKAQKKIDIKLLKSVIWKNLSLDETNGKRVNFSEIFSSLPEKLPPEEAAELSFPIAFMALLHLANEKTLYLQGTSKYSDVQVALG